MNLKLGVSRKEGTPSYGSNGASAEIEIELDPDFSVEDEGPPEDWPAWTDEITLELGPGLPLTDAEDLQVERTPWHDWLATPAEPQP